MVENVSDQWGGGGGASMDPFECETSEFITTFFGHLPNLTCNYVGTVETIYAVGLIFSMRTPLVCYWCVRFDEKSKNKHHKVVCLTEIGPSLQILLAIRDSIVSTIGSICVLV